MELWELMARESIRHTLASYNHEGDRGRLGELAAQFTEDGVLEIVDGPTYTGRADIEAGLGRTIERARGEAGSGPSPIVRHHVSSVLIHDVTPVEARAASYFAVLTGAGLDHWGRYRDTLVPVGDRWLIAHRTVRVDAKSAASSIPM